MSVKRHPKRGFTLIEAIAAMVILAIATPTSLVMLSDAARARASSAQITRAMWLADGVIETADADSVSEVSGIKYKDMNEPAYMPSLRARVDAAFGTFYAQYGLSYSVVIEPVDVTAQGGGYVAVVNLAQTDPKYKQITVDVSWTDSYGQARTLTVRSLVRK
jgi:prepilin-type N-terminal cleavage/methylation domain-containing protein